jgi:hypothetical protein
MFSERACSPFRTELVTSRPAVLKCGGQGARQLVLRTPLPAAVNRSAATSFFARIKTEYEARITTILNAHS